MINDKTLEEKIHRVLLIHGPSSKEIAKIIREEIQKLIENYQKRLKSLNETKESKEFEEHYKSYNDETYIQQYSYVHGKTYELDKVITDLGELLK